MTTGALAVLLSVWTAAVWFLNRPGHLTIDSLVQIAEGRSGVFESYNPLFISVVFGRLTALTGGTASLVFIAAAAFALAAWLLLSRIARPRLPGLLGCAVLLFLPILLIYPGIVWKDVWFAHSALLGFGLIALRAGRRGGPIGWGIEALCLALFAFAMLSRQTGVLVSLVGVVLLAIAARPAGLSGANPPLSPPGRPTSATTPRPHLTHPHFCYLRIDFPDLAAIIFGGPRWCGVASDQSLRCQP